MKKSIFFIFLFLLFLYSLLDLYSERYIPPDISINEIGLYDYTGSIHIHTVYSDGSGTPEEIADAASKLGIDFLIISDHDTLGALIDGKERYYNDVLVLTGVEISTEIGHILIYSPSADFRDFELDSCLVQLNNNKLPDYYAEFCHPFYTGRPVTDWSYKGFDALEIFNGDTQWRDDSAAELIIALLGSIIYKNPLNNLVDSPEKNIQKWCELMEERRIYQIGAVDAHSNIKISKNFKLKFPSYDKSLRFVKTHIVTKEKLSGTYDKDKYIVFNCLKKGKCYTELGNFTDPSGFIFNAKNEHKTAYIGDEIEGRVKFSVVLPDTADIIIKLYNNNKTVHTSDYYKMEYTTIEPGMYWIEVSQIRRKPPFFKKVERPWIISNPIFVSKNALQ